MGKNSNALVPNISIILLWHSKGMFVMLITHFFPDAIFFFILILHSEQFMYIQHNYSLHLGGVEIIQFKAIMALPALWYRAQLVWVVVALLRSAFQQLVEHLMLLQFCSEHTHDFLLLCFSLHTKHLYFKNCMLKISPFYSHASTFFFYF